jgi:hypothetical protein
MRSAVHQLYQPAEDRLAILIDPDRRRTALIKTVVMAPPDRLVVLLYAPSPASKSAGSLEYTDLSPNLISRTTTESLVDSQPSHNEPGDMSWRDYRPSSRCETKARLRISVRMAPLPPL